LPYTLESGKLHSYLTNSDKYLRISIKGESKKVISKENSEIIKDPYGLNCIIKRKEIKESLNPSLLVLPSKQIYRKRKYFITDNEKNRNSYCILIDRCTSGADELFQMEIEGLLFSASEAKEQETVKDIVDITFHLIRKYEALKPTTLTKLEWLNNH